MTACLVGMIPALTLEAPARPAHGQAVAGADEVTIATLVIAVRRGDEAAFRTLYDRFHRVVHAIALARLPASEAADVVQEVFTMAWQKLDQLAEPAAFAGWLLTLARHRVIDQARRQRPPTFELGDVAISPPPRAEAVAALAAIRALPETYREALIMRLVEGLTGPEIAAQTGMTADSVRVHLHRGLKLLRERLAGGEGAR
jgi:RNA polymerase sigma-70 factor (ECF subfamily)